jgi:hypothetical protein
MIFDKGSHVVAIVAAAIRGGSGSLYPCLAQAPEMLLTTGQAALEQRIDARLARFGLTATFSLLPTATPAPSTPSTTPLPPVAAAMPTPARPTAATPTEATELTGVRGGLNAAEQQISTLQQESARQPSARPAQETPVQGWQTFQATNPTFNAPQQGRSEGGEGGE